MLKSNALILGTIFFACFGIFSMFYGIFLTQIKLGETSQYNFLTKDNSPWFKPKVKVLMVIVDALRFDYLLEYENIEHLERLKLNKFKKFNQAFYSNPEQFVVLRAFADPPTWTVLRVPILMTGNIPQKVHIMTSFGALSAMEDSIPRQVKLGGKKTYFAGDPTLKEFFSEYLISGTKTKGFDIRDDQVDDAPHEYILQKVADNDFDMMIAHILMVDHTGHLHNILSQNELDAIDNADQFILDLMSSIDDDTMLIFAGDHGMTVDGNHGGSLPQETNTAIVAYHKKGFMKYGVNSELKKVMRSVNETEAQNHQVDLVPTLAMLMGLPIPFSNMGLVLNDLYPAGGNYLDSQSCSDATFAMQMLKDNHLNTLQILHYFYKYQKQNQVGTKEEMDRIKELEQEMNAAYKTAEDMVINSRQCDSTFNGVTVNAIQKSKKLTYEIYDFVNTKVPYEMAIFYQGFGLIILVAISYILLVQYLMKTEGNEQHLTWPNMKGVIKSTIAVVALIALICVVMVLSDARIMHPITISMFILGLWVFGSSMFFFLTQNKESSFSIKSLFLFQTPGVTAGAVAIIVYLFYLIHVYNVDREKIDKRHNLNPYIMVFLAALRICGKHINFSPFILGATGVVCTGMYFVVDIQAIWSEKINTVMGLFLLADWVWREGQFVQNNFKTSSKAWSYQYFVGLGVLAVYHMITKRETDLVQIYLPRIIWVIIIGSCLISFALKMPSQIIKRNMQVYLVLFMALLQAPKRLLYFAMVLSAMRIANFLFKRVAFKNYLYPIVICFIGYMGLFMTGFTDRTFPASFTQAFVGLRDFNIVFSILFYTLALMGTIILGMLFISYQDQDINLKGKEVKISEEEPLMEAPNALKDHSETIRKRNIILYGFFYNIIMISASIKIIVYRERHLSSEGVMEKFFVDAAFYIVIMITLYLML